MALMINSDLMIGLVAGNVYGYFFRPVFQFFFKYSVLIFKRSLLPSFLVVICIGILPAIGVGVFLLTVLFFNPYVIVWKTFVSVYFICFYMGIAVYAMLHRKQINKWD
jgi:hypothetical protein